MNRLLLLFALFFANNLLTAQTIKFQTGIAVSNFDWTIGSPSWEHENESLTGFSSFSIGLDYWNHKYFNLSSNLGYLKKGGKVTVKAIDGSDTYSELEIAEAPIRYDMILSAKLDYLSLNTCFEAKYPFKNNITPFISIGPRIDFLLNSYDIYKDNSYGLICGGGIKYNIQKIQIGIRSDYYWNFDNIDKNGEINDKTFTVNLTIGYKLR